MTVRHMPGEERHERCRYGMLAEAWASATGEDGTWVPADAVPVCAWTPGEAAPPHLQRAAGGAVEPERDCIACRAYAPL